MHCGRTTSQATRIVAQRTSVIGTPILPPLAMKPDGAHLALPNRDPRSGSKKRWRLIVSDFQRVSPAVGGTGNFLNGRLTSDRVIILTRQMLFESLILKSCELSNAASLYLLHFHGDIRMRAHIGCLYGYGPSMAPWGGRTSLLESFGR